MKKKALAVLFYSNFNVFFVGYGLLPLLPLYARQFGANSTSIGLYLAFTYVAITGGTILTGWLAERFMPKKILIVVGTLGAPALALLGQAGAFWQVIILTAAVWFFGGVGTALVSLLTGLYADKGSRGKSFGFMFLTKPLAALTGGMALGQLATWQGYELTFTMLGAIWAVWPIVVFLGLENRPISTAATTVASEAPAPFGRAFSLLLVSVFLATVTLYLNKLGTSLSMQALDFSAKDVGSATATGGLVAIPLTMLVGTLSDRLGRKGFLMLSYLAAMASALTLSIAGQLWHFWLAMALLLAAQTVSGTVASALATDLLPPQALSRGLPWLNAMMWSAGILGFASAGYTIDRLGLIALYAIAATLSVTAIIALGTLPQRRKEVIGTAPPLKAGTILNG